MALVTVNRVRFHFNDFSIRIRTRLRFVMRCIFPAVSAENKHLGNGRRLRRYALKRRPLRGVVFVAGTAGVQSRHRHGGVRSYEAARAPAAAAPAAPSACALRRIRGAAGGMRPRAAEARPRAHVRAREEGHVRAAQVQARYPPERSCPFPPPRVGVVFACTTMASIICAFRICLFGFRIRRRMRVHGDSGSRLTGLRIQNVEAFFKLTISRKFRLCTRIRFLITLI